MKKILFIFFVSTIFTPSYAISLKKCNIYFTRSEHEKKLDYYDFIDQVSRYEGTFQEFNGWLKEHSFVINALGINDLYLNAAIMNPNDFANPATRTKAMNVYVKDYLEKELAKSTNPIETLSGVDRSLFAQSTNSLYETITKSTYHKKLIQEDAFLHDVYKSVNAKFSPDYEGSINLSLKNYIDLVLLKTAQKKGFKEYLGTISKIDDHSSFYTFLISLPKTTDANYIGKRKMMIEQFAFSPYVERMHFNVDDFMKVINLDFTSEVDVQKAFPGLAHIKFNEMTLITKVVPVVKIANQGQLGSCHAHAGVTTIEDIISAATGRRVPLSKTHLYRKYLISELQRLIKNDLPFSEFSEGNYPQNVPIYSAIFGILPEESWNFPSNYSSPENSKKILSELEKIIADYSLNAKYAQGENLTKLKQKYQNDVFLVVDKYIGRPPEKFIFNGKEYTPLSLAKKYLGEIKQEYETTVFFPEHLRPAWKLPIDASKSYQMEIASSENPLDQKWNFVTHRENFKGKTIEELSQIVVQQIDKGFSVNYAFFFPANAHYEHHSLGLQPYLNQNTSLISAKVGDFEDEEFDGAHAVVIVGYELDLHGNVSRFKIQNSWGTEAGDNGFYYVDYTFFKNFTMQVVTELVQP